MDKDKQIVLILKKTLMLTLKGKLKWQVLSGQDLFAVKLDELTIYVKREHFAVIDSDGNVLDSIGMSADCSPFLRQLYDLARRQALGVDERLERLFRMLDHLDETE